ncbi:MULTISPECIES: amonabactin biosynthesis phosphopantetheinyl transferase AmoD [Aeromonas]|uniref:amonabactin biosynthesis phosphopantetheinyl transferase AmoD n=1 Tax=Aeromonas TaxID=642 RepID=UPI00244524C3|nr:amonabactin biosynthesis phosphopantetheinyl transferase AmoD [Aeromonas dhakensis]
MMFIATAPACSLDRFIVQADSLPLPCAAHLALQRVCFDPAAFTQACYDAAGMVLPASLQRAAPKRLGEFLAGRLAAREALRPFHLAEHPVAIGNAREPCWPAGFEGSISHSLLQGRGMALCAVRPGRAGMGLDLEGWLAEGQASELWPGIASGEEWARLVAAAPAIGLSRAEALTLIFSAKESLFKALYPRVGRYFDFLDARWLTMTEQTLTLELVDTLTPDLPAGWRCTLYWQTLHWQAQHWQTGHWQTRPGGVLTSLLL